MSEEVVFKFDNEASKIFMSHMITHMELQIMRILLSKFSKLDGKEQNWNQAKKEMLDGLEKIDFRVLVDDYFACSKKLHITRSRLSHIIKSTIINMSQFFQAGEPVDESNCSFEDLNEFTEQAINILVQKQQCSEKFLKITSEGT